MSTHCLKSSSSIALHPPPPNTYMRLAQLPTAFLPASSLTPSFLPQAPNCSNCSSTLFLPYWSKIVVSSGSLFPVLVVKFH